MASDSDPRLASGGSRVQELLEHNERLQREVLRIQCQLELLRERLSAQDAADEHHRAELETTRAETADAVAQLKEAQVRVEEWRRLVTEAKERQELAEHQRERAEQERAAVIAALGRRGRKQLGTASP